MPIVTGRAQQVMHLVRGKSIAAKDSN